MDDSRWSDARMASLDAGADWQPDAGRALGQLQRRRRDGRRRNWIYAMGAAAALTIALGSMAPRACANPRGCAETPAAAAAGDPAPVTFKVAGNPRAPIAIEIYSDYECPHCAIFHKETLPMLMGDYVKTGKVKLVYRDFPLPQHRNARLAARYANAAGAIGRYDAVAERLFRTQEIWSASGDIAGALGPVLTLGEMQAVQRAVESDGHLDAMVAEDLAAGQKDKIGSTPTLVIVWNGKRQAIAPIPAYSLLRSYLDSLAAQ